MTVTMGCMTIDHDGADYLWEQLADLIRNQIADGTYPPGSRLPSILEHAEQHGLSAVTVRKALDALAAEGAIVKRPGRGTYVRK